MAQLLPKALLETIDELGKLPGVGARTAERYAYFLLRARPDLAHKLAGAIDQLHAGVKLCPATFALIDPDEDVSPLYSGADRNKKLVAIVEEPLDIVALERTGKFRSMASGRKHYTSQNSSTVCVRTKSKKSSSPPMPQ